MKSSIHHGNKGDYITYCFLSNMVVFKWQVYIRAGEVLRVKGHEADWFLEYLAHKKSEVT